MATRRRPPTATLIGVALLTACSSATVHTDFDRGARFGDYKTYSWRVDTPAPNRDLNAFIVDAIDRELRSAGMKKLDSSGDVVVTYAVARGQRLDSDILNQMPRYGPGYEDEAAGVRARNFEVGTLVVGLADEGGQHLVWRAAVSDALGANPEEVRGQVEKAVKKMFADYPPRP